MVNINDFVKDAQTIKDLFINSREVGVFLKPYKISDMSPGLKSIEERTEFAIVKALNEHMGSVRECSPTIHPYGSDILYHFVDRKGTYLVTE